MGTVFRSALLVQFEPPRARIGDLRQENGCITAIGDDITAEPGDEVIQCDGAVLMPGLVNGHTHLYSALAAGMPAPPRTATNFHENLRYVWWRLDRAHTMESVQCSGLIGALSALRCGTTTLIDHHASPNAIDGSLDALERGIARVGCRGVLCYEVTDRNGLDGAAHGLRENDRYINACETRSDGCFAGMVGAHASFTLGEESLAACVDLAQRLGAPMHIHAAEDPVDERLTRANVDCGLLERFERSGLLDVPGTIIVHGTYFPDSDIASLNERADALVVAHNPRSNMKNGVGYSPVAKYTLPVMLGTDGIDGDMWTEAQTAFFKSRDAHLGITPDVCLRLLSRAARAASTRLGVTLGVLDVGAAADLVLTSYRPATPMDETNLAGHVIFAMGAQHVRDVMIDGHWRLRDGKAVSCDEAETLRDAQRQAQLLYDRMATIACE
ncbi:MAG: amidohydrolase family protein [Phycisphaerales bacterium]|nr:amidohydrolase family protein [Phycisphaerales bacterium]